MNDISPKTFARVNLYWSFLLCYKGNLVHIIPFVNRAELQNRIYARNIPYSSREDTLNYTALHVSPEIDNSRNQMSFNRQSVTFPLILYLSIVIDTIYPSYHHKKENCVTTSNNRWHKFILIVRRRNFKSKLSQIDVW